MSFEFKLLSLTIGSVLLLFAIGIILENHYGWFPINLIQGP